MMTSGTDRPRVHLLHTSDVHVCKDDGHTLRAFAAVIDATLATGADVLIIAGDLFDSARVPMDVADQVLEELARVSVPTVVVPGNHDCIDERSIYHRVDLSRAGSHVLFARDPDGQRFVLADLGLGIWARGIENHEPGYRPLAGYEPAGSTSDRLPWEVVVSHGHYVQGETETDRSSRISHEEIGALECDYLALGHWHRFLEVSEGNTTAFYSGSPSESANGPTVNLVTLDPAAGVGVERIPIEIRPAVLNKGV